MSFKKKVSITYDPFIKLCFPAFFYAILYSIYMHIFAALTHLTLMQLQLPGELLKVLRLRPHPRTIKSESPGIVFFLNLPNLSQCVTRRTTTVPLIKYPSSPLDWELLEGTNCLLIFLVINLAQ